MKVFVVFVLAAIVSLQKVNANTKCYECGDGPLEPKKTCEGNEKDWEQKKCNAGGGMCQTLTLVDGGKTIVTRNCYYGAEKKPGCKTKKTIKGKEFQQCWCKGDLCNGAFNAQASVVGITLLVMFSSMLFN